MYHQSQQVDLQQLQREVNQLKCEAKIERKKVSECASDLVNYIKENSVCDPLLNKVPANENPFRERNRGCLLL